jgi:hypothetical protein
MVPVELGILIVLVLLLGAGAIETLRQIRDAIQENYQASLTRAMTTTDIAVTPEKEKVVKACVCGHAVLQHWSVVGESGPAIQGGKCHHTDDTGKPDCGCQLFKPKRGPWPGEVKV